MKQKYFYILALRAEVGNYRDTFGHSGEITLDQSLNAKEKYEAIKRQVLLNDIDICEEYADDKDNEYEPVFYHIEKI